MDVFSLRPEDTKYFFISESKYFDETHRRFPWITQTKGNPPSPLYLATCPECKNAIEIRELDRVRGENHKNPREPFGQHYPHDVLSLGITYDKVAYDGCSLRGESSLNSKSVRNNEAFSLQILMTLVEDAAVVREVMSTRLGFNVSERLFESMIRIFVTQGRYRCKGVTPSNLPFALAYWSESQNIIAAYIKNGQNDMMEAIDKSTYFCLDGQQISSKHWRTLKAKSTAAGQPIPKVEWGPHRISMYFGDRVHTGDEALGDLNSMTLNFTEHTNSKKEGTKIFSKKVEYSNQHFPNAVLAYERRLQATDVTKAAADLKKKISDGNVAYGYVKPHLPADWLPSWLQK